MFDWRVLHEALITETNTTVLERLVHETEGAILKRFQELARQPDNHNHADELHALKAATDDLLNIKVHKLGWPDPLVAPDPSFAAPRGPAQAYDYDIFAGLPEKEPRWLETVRGLSVAYERVKQLAKESPGHYFIFDPRTSQTIMCRAFPL